MKKLNKKAQGSGAISMLAVVVGMLLIGAVMLVFVFQFGRASTGAISAGQCKSTIELVNNYNSAVDKQAQNAKSKVDCEWKWGIGGNSCVGGQGFVALGGMFVKPAVDAGAELLKINSDLCLKDLETSCPNVIGKTANAADAAECVYKHAVTTYYTLQGGRSNPKYDFNLFKMSIEFFEPGTVTVSGKCDDYLTSAAPRIPINSKDECFPKLTGDIYICGKNDGAVTEWPGIANTCQITFSRLNEATMTLAMVARCQNETPDSSACKLFADPDRGYSTVNGLPNLISFGSNYIKADRIFGRNGATYPGKDYGKYSGAGYNSDFFKGGDFVEIGKEDSKASMASIYEDSILAGALDVKLGETKTCKLRLRGYTGNNIVKVVIEGDEDGKPCDEIPEEEQP
ncbi:TPA: hypothetical protein H1012_00075 [archaeon]|nr:hypothetical protein [Candidatus Naiadarchaeales archaeon SRR2090159.bin1288]